MGSNSAVDQAACLMSSVCVVSQVFRQAAEISWHLVRPLGTFVFITPEASRNLEMS